ncbi:MAG: hypothetical protein Tsb0015_05090 [Simkaniaceae bacterium]
MYQVLLHEAKKDLIDVLWISALIRNQNLILLLSRGPAKGQKEIYEFPATNLLQEETIPQALQRIVMEDTNLETSNFLGFIGHFDFVSKSKEKHRHLVFAVEVKDPLSIQIKSHRAFAWIEPKEAVGYPIEDGLRQIIDNYERINFFPQGKL